MFAINLMDFHICGKEGEMSRGVKDLGTMKENGK